MPKITQNAIRIIPTGQILISRDVHDYVEGRYGPGDNETAFTDGGQAYIRRSVNPENTTEDLTLYDNSLLAHHLYRQLWGTRGKDGTTPPHHVFLRNCETDHLKAILDTQDLTSTPHIVTTIYTILEFRKTDPTWGINWTYDRIVQHMILSIVSGA